MPQRVQTVLGPVSPDTLGVTLTHEHFSLDFDKFYCEPPKELLKYLDAKQNPDHTINLQNVGFIRQYPYGSRYNIDFQDKDSNNAVLKDLKMFKHFGGGSIVENTTYGINRDLKLMHKVATSIGINVISGTGHYLSCTQKKEDLKMTIEEMVKLYTSEIVDGVDVILDDGKVVKIKCGLVGEIGSAYPINDFERRSIVACAEVQQALKCGVSFHPGRDSPQSAFDVLRIYLEAGGAADKAVMSHLDRTILDDDQLLEFSDLGSYCQYDFFGLEVSHFMMNDKVDMPSDAQRIEKILHLIDHGKLDRVVISHDIHTKHRLVEYGGHGFAHILTSTIPKMLTRNLSQDQIDQITKRNPANWLQFEC